VHGELALLDSSQPDLDGGDQALVLGQRWPAAGNQPPTSRLHASVTDVMNQNC
jgi:hypothetical protein